MWYPEEPVTYCPTCDLEVPASYCWRSRGVIISATGRRERTPVLNSLCPNCGTHRNVGLDGGRLYRWIYRYLWELRYPKTRAPRLRRAVETEPVIPVADEACSGYRAAG